VRPPDAGGPGTGPVPQNKAGDQPELPGAPFLENCYVVLEPLRVAHAKVMARALGDPRLYEYTGGTPPTADELRSRYERQVRGRSPDGGERWFNWVVKERPAGQAVGYVQATVHRGRAGLYAEVAWVIGVPYQGRGLAKSAAELMAQWLYRQGVRRLKAHVHPEHFASGAVAAHLGLSPQGRLQGGEAVWAGELHPPPGEPHGRAAASRLAR
jgi:RimJ/RimL family protein N-acetyltransferase